MMNARLASRPLRSRFVHFVLALSLGLAPILHAQPSAFHFEHFPELGPIVWFAHQDQEGFLWIGTWEGLFRYDGNDFKGYFHIPEDTTSLLGNLVSFTHEDREGTLWFGTLASGNRPGLNRYDRKTDTFTRFAYDSGSGLNTIYEDREGTLWVGTQDRGLNRFDPASGTFIPFTPDSNDAAGLGRSDVRAIYEDRTGTLWLGVGHAGAVRGGLVRFERDSQAFTHFTHDPGDPNSIGPGTVSALLQDSEGRFWIGTSEGDLCRTDLSEETFSCNRLNPDVENSISKIHEDGSGMLWVGTSEGLHRFDPQTGRIERFQYDAEGAAGLEGHALRSNSIENISQDRSGVLWVSTFAGGLYKLSRTVPLFTAYVPPAPEPGVYGILEDRAGLLWLSARFGLYRLDRSTGQWTSFVHDPDDPTSLSYSWAVDLYEDASGRLWVGTWGGGLNRYDPRAGTFTHFRHDAQDSTSLSGDDVWDIYEDRAGRLWIGTREGLNLMDQERGTFTRFTHDPDDPKSIGANEAMAVLEDSKSRFWIGMSKGGLNLMEREAGTFTRYVNDPDDPASLSINDVNAIAEDRAGMLWIGTHGGGLNRFDPETGTAARFNTANSCLPSNRVVAILEDEQRHLWLNTGLGLVRFDPDAHTCVAYDTHDGLAGLQGFREGYKSPRGEFFFATFNGAHSFFPEEISGSAEPPPVVLTDFRLFNRSVVPGPESPLKERITAAEEIVLAYDQNSVGFEFAALHFVRPEKNRYAYRLEGFDADWIQAGRQHAASYTNLSPGAYVLRVKAANSDGLWNEEGTSIRVVVLPPWWRTIWAYVLYGLLFAAGVFAVDRVQRRRLIRREREKSFLREKELRAEAAEAWSNYLQSENQRQTHELDAARQLQLSMLPERVPDHPTVELAAYMKTATEVGGDYYDFDLCDDGTLTVAIGDATGHGAEAGIMVTAMKSLWNAFSREPDLEAVLCKSNQALKRMHLPKLYMALALIRLRDHTLELAGAGMPPALVYRAASGCIEEVALKGMPLGSPGVYPYRRQCVLLSPGDTVVLMSDGFPELFGASGQRLGYDRMPGLFAEAAGRSSEEVIAHLIETAKAWCNGQVPDDDMTFVVMKVKA
jgi:ligand-binding sensor domain-containing protein/serine phosphatase RsbU (regulator of sigma subunit)